MSKKQFITGLVIVAIAAVCVAAATAEELRDLTWQRLDAAAEKQRALASKVYTGTFAEILAVRAADVNEVTTDIAVAKVTAVEAIEAANDPAVRPDPNGIKLFITEVIAEKSKQAAYQQRLQNATFLIAVEELAADPNNVPDPNDLDEQRRLQEFRTACLTITDLLGGI
ncbi:MAG: hypothetical protein LLF76_00360 [Planctomycetaceae bacterium]|nr:hypothetical protein [Planctomycetaceae bacterium]